MTVTVSIVAFDAETGRLGVATASFVLGVGSAVPHLRRGVGAAAVQAGAPFGWGDTVMELLASGRSPADVCDELGSMPGAEFAQVAVVDAHGEVGVLSGNRLEPVAEDATGPSVCAAANLMERPGVPRAVVEAYIASAAPQMSGRLLDALIAADEMGGDLRGRQSAALVVVLGPFDTPDQGRYLDLRVDDARRPTDELARLHRLWEAHQLLAGSRDADGLYRDVELTQAALTLAPSDQGCLGAAGLALLRAGRLDEALPIFRQLMELEARTPARIARLADGGLLDKNIGAALLEQFTRQADVNAH